MAYTFQRRVAGWILACFGAEVAKNRAERNHRFLEEALELVQSCGCTKDDALLLVEYVYNRHIGKPHQEVGGVLITLTALCSANGIDLDAAGEDELERCYDKIELIRSKQAAKVKNSALPSSGAFQ